jgi:hypothetical protein
MLVTSGYNDGNVSVHEPSFKNWYKLITI